MKYEVRNREFRLTFDQNAIDWMNLNYPEKHWVFMNKMLQMRPSLALENDVLESMKEVLNASINMEHITLSQFEFPVDIFWNYNSKVNERLVNEFCEYICDYYPHVNVVHLFTLNARMVRYDGDTIIDEMLDVNGHLLRKVGASWHMKGVLADV